MKGNAEKFSSILKEYVSERRKANPKVSECQIARNLGVSRTTFNRMLNYDSYPSVRNLFKLCKVIPKLKILVTKEILEVTRESKTGKYMGEELENLLFHENLFITYALALSDHGVTDEEITYCMGHEGKQSLKILIKKGFIVKTADNKYRATETDKGIIYSFDIIRKHIEILIAKCKPDNVKNNYIYYKMETVNKEGLKKLYEMQKEIHRGVQQLMEDEKYKGSLPIFAIGCLDMLPIKEPANKEEKEEAEKKCKQLNY